MKRIKIIFGLEAVGGGALKHLAYLVTRINKNRFDVTVVLSTSRKENSEFEIRKIKSSGAKTIFLKMKRNINPFIDLVSFFQILTILRNQKYDIVHAHSSKAGGLFRIAAFLCGVPRIIYTPHCFYFQGKKGIRKLVFVIIEKLLAKITSVIIVSENEKKEIIKNRIAHPGKCININNAIDFNEYRQNGESELTLNKLGIPRGTFVIGAVGRLVPQKDWDTYIFAAKEVLFKYPDTVFVIAGEGDLKNSIQKRISEFGLEGKVILTGYYSDICKLYAIMDVFVNTSLWEGLPYVFLEAMRYNKTIITTDTGNESTIVNDENGFIVPVRDYFSVADKIIKLIENKQMAVTMGEKGNKILTQKYSFELFIKEHEKQYVKGFYS